MTSVTSSRATEAAAEANQRPVADAVLLARFVRQRDEEAFAEIVRRHGPMVLSVARRVLADDGEAEDAFQATFMVLARRAGELKSPELLAGWLHGVAQRTSSKGRTAMIRRHTREREIDNPALLTDDGAAADRDGWCRALHEELSQMPDKYRAALVLCYLEGVTHAEAAARLGWPSGSMSRRLERGRELLRQRMLRRGIVLPGVALISLLWQQAATAAIPARLVDRTVQGALAAAEPLAAGGAGGAGAASAAGGGGQTVKLLAAAALALAALLAVLIQTPLGAYVPWGSGVSSSAAAPIGDDSDLAIGNDGDNGDLATSASGCCPETAAAEVPPENVHPEGEPPQ